MNNNIEFKDVESVRDFISSKEKENHDRVINRQKKIRELEQENKDLKAICSTFSDFEELQQTKERIKTNNEHINFLIEQRNKPQGASITQKAFNDMQSALDNKVKELREKAAPEIQEHLFAAIELMDKYTGECNDISALASRAWNLLRPEYPYIKDYHNTIGDVNPDEWGWWYAFVNMYYSNADSIAMKKATSAGSGWKK